MAGELRRRPALLRHAAVAGGAALYGGITVGGRYFSTQGFSLLEISLTGTLFGALLLAPVVVGSRRYRLRRGEIPFFIAFGAVGAVLQLTQFAGIVLGVPVALVALLLYTQPIWTLVLGRVWLGEPLSTAKLSAAALAIGGTVILIDPLHVARRYSALGLVAALAAGFMLSLWVLFARSSALRGNRAITTTFGYTAFSAGLLLLTAPGLQALVPAGTVMRLDPGVWIHHGTAVAGYTLAASVMPAILAMWGMRRVHASVAGLLLLLEPMSAALMAWAWFAEPLSSNVWLGGALILVANGVVLAGEREVLR